MELKIFLQQKQVAEDLQEIFLDLVNIGKQIKKEIQQYNQEKTVMKNSSGDMQMALDRHADEIALEYFKRKKSIIHYASEEQEEVISVNNHAKYSIALDPLDGSSLINVNFAVGTIAAIHEGSIIPERRNIVAALYLLYGPLTTLVIAPGDGKGVHEFLLQENGEFIRVKENITFKERGKTYSTGGERASWSSEHSNYILRLEQEGYKLRYSGCFVADANLILLKNGGIFTYPKTRNAPQGKLRVCYELEPLAFIFIEAGGAGIDGKDTFINRPLQSIHEKAPAYLGSKYEVEFARKMLNE